MQQEPELLEDTDEASKSELESQQFERLTNFARLRASASNLFYYVWRQGTDFASPSWPPKWLLGMAIVFLVLAFLLIVKIASVVQDVVGVIAGALLNNKLTGTILGPVHSYLESHAQSIPMSADDLWVAWVAFGIVLFLASLGRVAGGRAGWMLFGLITTAMVWDQTSPPSKWVAAGLTVLTWSVLLLVGGRGTSSQMGGARSHKPRKQVVIAMDPFHSIKRRSGKRAQKLGYDSLASYFEEKGNEARKNIASELELSNRNVKEILEDHFPVDFPARGKTSPRVQREILRQWRESDVTYAELRRRTGVNEKAIKAIVTKYSGRSDI